MATGGPTLRLFDGYDDTNPGTRTAVRSLQEALRSHGFDVDVDGYFGPGTEEGVERFQRAMGLPVDGVVEAGTWAALQGATPPAPGSRFETHFDLYDSALVADLRRAEGHRKAIRAAALVAGVPESVIFGIGSRETRWGGDPRMRSGTGDTIKRKPRPPLRPGALPPDGLGFGRGLLQIDWDAHEFARTGRWRDAEANIRYGGQVLAECRSVLRRRVVGLATERGMLRAMVAAYNCGAGNVSKAIGSGRDVDFFTHGRDYSRDVLARAGWAQMAGWD